MKVLMCGDRNWKDVDKIKKVFDRIEVTTLIHGAARGADTLAGEEARRRGIEVIKFPANWEQYGKAAGPIRNTQMLVEGNPEFVVAFHSNIEESKGTKNMILQAIKIGVPVEIIT